MPPVIIDIARQHLLDKIGRGLTATDHQGKAGVEQLVLDSPLEEAGFEHLVPLEPRDLAKTETARGF